jgi:hypothetical protein
MNAFGDERLFPNRVAEPAGCWRFARCQERGRNDRYHRHDRSWAASGFSACMTTATALECSMAVGEGNQTP